MAEPLQNGHAPQTEGGAMRSARLAVIAIAAVALSTLAAPAQAAPARSGTITGVYYPEAAAGPVPPPRCVQSVDCRAWLASGCLPALAGRDPALWSSIVDVRGLAGMDTIREFRVRRERPHSRFNGWPRIVSLPRAAFLGNVGVEFWSGDCVGIAYLADAYSFRIPAGAAWMTVSTGPGWLSTGSTVTWTLS